MQSALCSVLESLGMNDRFQVEKRPVKQLVDYNVVEVLGLDDLVAGVGQADLDDVV